MRYSAISGYSDRLSVRARETIQFMVSYDQPAAYRAQLVRIRCGDTNPGGPATARSRSKARSTAPIRAARSRCAQAPMSFAAARL